jgi:Leucine-rich repeat (LRR) protein
MLIHFDFNQVKEFKSELSINQVYKITGESNSLLEIDSNLISTNNRFLKILDLKNNSIAKISIKSFSFCNEMESLDLSLNLLSEIENETFIGLQNLNHLNLSSNRIESISSESFKILRKLLTLDLSFNNLVSIEDFTFDTLNLLTDLNINENQLYSILNNKGLNGLYSLRNLWIEHDLITEQSNINSIIESMRRRTERIVKEIQFFSSLEIKTGLVDVILGEKECLRIIYLL